MAAAGAAPLAAAALGGAGAAAAAAILGALLELHFTGSSFALGIAAALLCAAVFAGAPVALSFYASLCACAIIQLSLTFGAYNSPLPCVCVIAVLPADLHLRQELLRHELACVAEALKVKGALKRARPAALEEEEEEEEEGEEEEEEEEGGAAQAAAQEAIRKRVAVSLAAQDSALLTVADHLTSLTRAMFSLTPDLQAALRAKLDPGALLALSALTDRAGDVMRRSAAEEAAGGPRGLLDMLDIERPQGGAAPQAPTSLPVPTLYYPTSRTANAVRLTWLAWHQLWHEGLFASMSGAAANPFLRTRKCPALNLALEPADLTWSRDEAHQPALSKAILLCRLINAVTEYEVAQGRTLSEAKSAMAERFTNAWSKSKESALRGARSFFRDGTDTKYAGQDLTDFFKPPARGRGAGEGDDI